jgi:hypothetical protein
MNHQDIVALANAKNALDAMEEKNLLFLQHCNRNGTPSDIQTRLDVSGITLRVDCFGKMAEATCRYVRTVAGGFAAEYVFRIAHGDTSVEAWRCYVTSNARLATDPEGQVTICDCDNSYIAKHICGSVLQGVLQSSAFAVSP